MSSYQLDFILRLMAARAASDPALRMQQPWQAAWEQDYAWFGEAVTQHYRGDDSALRVLLGGSRWRKFAFRAQLTSPPSHALHGHRTSLQPQTHGA